MAAMSDGEKLEVLRGMLDREVVRRESAEATITDLTAAIAAANTMREQAEARLHVVGTVDRALVGHMLHTKGVHSEAVTDTVMALLVKATYDLEQRTEQAERRARDLDELASDRGVELDMQVQRAEQAERERDEARKWSAAWGEAARDFRCRWSELVHQKIKTPWFHYEDGKTLDVVVEHPVFLLIAEFMREAFKVCGGENYVEWKMQALHDPLEVYSLTMQRHGGRTPAELKAAAERERDEAVASAAAMRGALEDIASRPHGSYAPQCSGVRWIEGENNAPCQASSRQARDALAPTAGADMLAKVARLEGFARRVCEIGERDDICEHIAEDIQLEVRAWRQDEAALATPQAGGAQP